MAQGVEHEHMSDARQLKDLRSVGEATLRDFRVLGIHSVRELAVHEPKDLYRTLCLTMTTTLDVCVLDVFTAAVAQARDPNLPREKQDWWYWSRQRKSRRSNTP